MIKKAKVEQPQFNKQTLINDLIKSNHGDLRDYVPTTIKAAKEEPEFLAHLIAWNLLKGEIRDSKVALPILNLRGLQEGHAEFAENAIASLLTLDPKNLLKAFKFSKELNNEGLRISGGYGNMLERGIKKYLVKREENRKWWIKTAVQHRKSLKGLYSMTHFQNDETCREILFEKEFPKNSVFEKIANLKNMSPAEAAGTILNYEIPFQIALGALGVKKEEMEKNPEFLLALMKGMSGQQLLNSTKFLDSLGVFKNKMLKSEYDKAFKKAKSDKKVSTLKANKAIKHLEEDPDFDKEILENLSKITEAKISQKTIEGDWVILGDRSGSMSNAIKIAKEIASYITKSVAGKVYLIFFNSDPRIFDVTGKTLVEIEADAKHINATGCTSCGCGLEYLKDKGIIVNGIAIVSDGGDNTYPLFYQAYKDYCKKMEAEPTVYFYRVPGDPDELSKHCQSEGIKIDYFNMEKTDYYSLPNIVTTMKTSHYSLMDEIMNVPLLTFDKIFKMKGK